MSSRASQALARPFTLGSAELPNRIVMAPMTTDRDDRDAAPAKPRKVRIWDEEDA